jgi:type III secretion system YscQ/HrcQ family protein
MTPAPWYPRLFLNSGEEQALWNAILSYRDQPLQPQGSKAAFRFSAIELPDPATPALLVRSEKGPHLAVSITAFPFYAMFGAGLEMADLRKLPSSLRNHLEEGILETLWQAIPDNRMGRTRIVTAGPLDWVVSQIGAQDLQWLSVSADGIAPEPITVAVGVSINALAKVMSDGALAPAAAVRGLKSLIQTEAFYTLGALPLHYSQLIQLRPGDVVVLPEFSEDKIFIRAQGLSYTFRLFESGWVCMGRGLLERYRRDPAAMEEIAGMPQASEYAGEAVLQPAELSVIVDFDIGRLTLPLSELQTWQPGSAVALQPPAMHGAVEVTVRANGQVVAIGDLVRIDDRLAVRLTRLILKS